MINKWLYINSLVVLIFSSSCFNQTDCKKVELSKEEMEWFKNYTNGDTVFFQNQVKEIDTFIIEDFSKTPDYTTCNKFELGPFIYASCVLIFRNQDNYPKTYNGFSNKYALSFDKVGQDSTDLDCKKGLSFFDLSTATGGFLDFSRVPTEEYLIKGSSKKVKIYLYTKNLNCSNLEGGAEVMQQFAISKEYGLMWYKTLKGDLYERIW